VCPDPHCEWCVGIVCRAITEEAPLCSILDIHPPAPSCSPTRPPTPRQFTLSCVHIHMHTHQLHCDWRRGTRVGSALQPCCHARCVPFGQNGFAHDALRMCATVGVSLWRLRSKVIRLRTCTLYHRVGLSSNVSTQFCPLRFGCVSANSCGAPSW
jgi:hypothetical protein